MFTDILSVNIVGATFAVYHFKLRGYIPLMNILDVIKAKQM